MGIKGRAASGLAVAAFAATAGLLTAGAAHATTWDSRCTNPTYEAQIYSPSMGNFCYYGTGPAYANVSGVTSLYAGNYNAAFTTSIGTQYFTPFHGASGYSQIHAGNFTLS